jgi:hypothetical protein
MGENEQEEIIFNVNLIGGELTDSKEKKPHKHHHEHHAKAHSQHSQRHESNHSKQLDETPPRYDYIHHKDHKQIQKIIAKEENTHSMDNRESESYQHEDNVTVFYGMQQLEINEDYFGACTDDSWETSSCTVSESPVCPLNRLSSELLTASESTPKTESPNNDSNSNSNSDATMSKLLSGNASVSSSRGKRQSFTHYFKEKAAQLKQKAKELNDSVSESGGIYQATKLKLHNVYERTKQSIDETIQDKIIKLHIYLSGYEPYRTPEVTRVICGLLTFDFIEIHMYKALPHQIRHLEAKPLIVDKLEFREIGYDNLEFIKIKGAGELDPSQCSPQEEKSGRKRGSSVGIENESSDYIGSSRSTRSQPHSRKRFSFRDERIISDGGLKKSYSHQSMETMTESSNLISKASSSPHVENHYTSKQHRSLQSAQSPSVQSQTPTSSKQPLTSPITVTLRFHSKTGVEIIEENHSNQIINLFSIDIWKSGLDALIFKYQFERKILYALYKSNAGNR